MDQVEVEIKFSQMMMGELLSRGEPIITHHVDGDFTACGRGTIDPADDISPDWDAVTCPDCKTQEI